MTRYVAFLRAVNVGGHATLKMESLRRAFMALGFENVRTLLASGNVVFEAGEPAAAGEAMTARIEGHLRDKLGLGTMVMLRTRREIEKLVQRDPFGDEASGRAIEYYVAFLARKPKAGYDLPIVSAKDGLELFSVEGREAFLIRRRVIGRYGSPNDLIEAKLGVAATFRNWNTVLKIGGHHT
ncbi:MAG: DUF1697 domain-containing protein [Candidatus Aminicenantes bacterium]|nr:DUF1697 domain-containing protein [Candidatus Aminicenantes bacterium]